MTQLEIRPAPVRRSLLVKTNAERAFTAFTGRIGRWWPRTHSIGAAAQVDVVLEPRPGGRWYERSADGSECEWGKVLIWDPPGRLVLAWQVDANWKYDPTLVLEVEVTFTPMEAALTRVDLEHRNLERYGEKASIVRDMIGSDSGWLGILKSYALEAESTAGG